MRRSRALAAALGVLALVAALVPALASGSAEATPSGTTSVTVFLKPGDASELTRLANRAVTDDSVQSSALDGALPSDAAHRSVVADLEKRGFTVTDETSWSVTATAPSTLVSRVFGALRGVLDVPRTLRSLVSAVFSTAGAKFVKPLALQGADLRRAYTSVANTKKGMAPYTGKDRAHKLTIATIQFSGWKRKDLRIYAHRHHLPYKHSKLVQVPAGRKKVPHKSSGYGAVEVALDQESLLSTSPHSKQRAFFAPNTKAGFAKAFAKVLDDARGNKHAYHGGDRHIAALSVSWGACERNGSANFRKAVNPILKSLVAAGVTIFAASGDAGAYDCSGLVGPAKGVDFPAASPYVIGVGGTHLSGKKKAAYNGRNWHERAWSCTSASNCTKSGGSGGGHSGVFGKPHFQRSVSGTGRMVPDIAAVGAPATGFVIYSSRLHGLARVGGTSLAAPVSAALMTNMLASRGMRHGIGNVNARLYAAARSAKAYKRTFRDVRKGRNGAYSAKAGYDTVTGLGAPLWPALGNRFFHSKRPTARVTIKRRHPHSKKKWRRVTLHWGGHAAGSTKLLSAEVVVRNGKGHIVLRRSAARPRGTVTFTGKPGRRYKAIVQVVNGRHAMSATTTAKVRVHR